MSYERLRAILDSCEMSQYMPAFEKQAYDDSLLQEITNEVLLNDIGISIAGHRARILKALNPPSASKATSKLKGFQPNPTTPRVAVAGPMRAVGVQKAVLSLQNTKGKPVEFQLGNDKKSIGRYEENDISLADPSVSGNHAEITFLAGKYQLHDLGSTNGTTVNGSPITHAVLNNGDIIRFGNMETVFKTQAAVPVPSKKPVLVVKSSSGSTFMLICGCLLFGLGYYLRQLPSDSTASAAHHAPRAAMPLHKSRHPVPEQPASERGLSQEHAQEQPAPVVAQAAADPAENQTVPTPAAQETAQAASEPTPEAAPAEPQTATPETTETSHPQPTPKSVSTPSVVSAQNAPKGLVLSSLWDSALSGGSQTAADLQLLLSNYATPQRDLGPKDILVYRDIKYLTPIKEALAQLRTSRSLYSKTKSSCSAFPSGSFYHYTLDGAFDDQFNRMLIVVDSADQVVAVQLVDEKPEQKTMDGDLKWHTYNFVQQREKAKRSLLISHEVESNSGCVVINTFLIDPEHQRSRRSTGQPTSRTGTPLERVRLYLPQPVADLILYKINKAN